MCNAEWTDPFGLTFHCTVNEVRKHEEHVAGQCGNLPPVVIWRDDGTVVDLPGHGFGAYLRQLIH